MGSPSRRSTAVENQREASARGSGVRQIEPRSRAARISRSNRTLLHSVALDQVGGSNPDAVATGRRFVRELDQDHLPLLIHLHDADRQISLFSAHGEEVLLDQDPLTPATDVPNAHTAFGGTHARGDLFAKDGGHDSSSLNQDSPSWSTQGGLLAAPLLVATCSLRVVPK